MIATLAVTVSTHAEPKDILRAAMDKHTLFSDNVNIATNLAFNGINPSVFVIVFSLLIILLHRIIIKLKSTPNILVNEVV